MTTHLLRTTHVAYSPASRCRSTVSTARVSNTCPCSFRLLGLGGALWVMAPLWTTCTSRLWTVPHSLTSRRGRGWLRALTAFNGTHASNFRDFLIPFLPLTPARELRTAADPLSEEVEQNRCVIGGQTRAAGLVGCVRSGSRQRGASAFSLQISAPGTYTTSPSSLACDRGPPLGEELETDERDSGVEAVPRQEDGELEQGSSGGGSGRHTANTGEHRCLPPALTNHVICHETATVREVLAVVWAQGHCNTFASINIGTSLYRIVTLCSQASPSEQSQMRKDLLNHRAFSYLVELVDKNLNELTPWSISTVIWSFAKLGYTPEKSDLLSRMFKAIVDCCDMTPTRVLELSKTLWAMSALGYQPSKDVMAAFERQLCTAICELANQEDNLAHFPAVCMLISAFIRMDHQITEETKQAMLLELRRTVHKLDPRGIVTVVFGMWKLKLEPDELLWEKLNVCVEKHFDSLPSQGISALLAVYSTEASNSRSKHWLGRLHQLVSEKLAAYSGRGLATESGPILHRNPEDLDLRQRLQKALVEKFRDGSLSHSVGITSFLSSIAECPDMVKREDGKTDFAVLKKAWDCLQSLIEDGRMPSEQLSWCLSSIAKLGHFPTRSLMAASTNQLKQDIDSLPLVTAAASIRSLGRLRWYSPALLDSYSKILVTQLREARLAGGRYVTDMRCYSQIIMGYATFGHETAAAAPLLEEMVDAIREQMTDDWPDSNDMVSALVQGLPKALWASAMIEILDEPVVGELCNLVEVIYSKMSGSLANLYPTTFTQLFHAKLAGDLQPGSRLNLSPALEAQCFNSWKVITAMVGESFIQEEVFREVKKLVKTAQREKLTPDGLFSLDISFTDRKGRTVALEVDGPMHFTSNAPYRPLKPYVIRNRLMRSRGYVLAVVTLPEWRKAKNKKRYLLKTLQMAGIELPVGS